MPDFRLRLGQLRIGASLCRESLNHPLEDNFYFIFLLFFFYFDKKNILFLQGTQTQKKQYFLPKKIFREKIA